MKNRSLLSAIEDFSQQKFVLLSGPRQVGKSTLAKQWLEKNNGVYLNWDIARDKRQILSNDYLYELKTCALVLDELHKYKRWKSLVKGLFDARAEELEVLITGSARLDIFQRSGDSLLGRYEYLRLHPFSLGELSHGKLLPPPDNWLECESNIEEKDLFLQLERFSGFPEPFSKADPRQYNRWANRRMQLLVQEDLRELENVKELSLIEHLSLILPERVASPLSLNSLREELQVSHDSVSRWLKILERLYFVFTVLPYNTKLAKSIKKQAKVYCYDWAQVSSDGARFENFVASHLLKSVQTWTDLGYGNFELRYFRDSLGNEVDFIITQKNKPIVLIEAKTNDISISSSLLYLGKQLGNVAQIQIVRTSGVNRKKGNVRVISADRFFGALC